MWFLSVTSLLFHATSDSPEQCKRTGSPVLTTRAGGSGLITGDADPARKRESENAKMTPKDSLLGVHTAENGAAQHQGKAELGTQTGFLAHIPPPFSVPPDT